MKRKAAVFIFELVIIQRKFMTDNSKNGAYFIFLYLGGFYPKCLKRTEGSDNVKELKLEPADACDGFHVSSANHHKSLHNYISS